MNYRGAFIFFLLLGAAAGSWFLVSSRNDATDIQTAISTSREGYYLLDAKLKGIGKDGKYLYQLRADEAAQNRNENTLTLKGVKLRYSPDHQVPWNLVADTGVVDTGSQRIVLSGNVRAESDDQAVMTSMSTSELEISPEEYVARTDKHVTIQVGNRSLSATGMLAFLNEDRIELQSNVSGKFLP